MPVMRRSLLLTAIALFAVAPAAQAQSAAEIAAALANCAETADDNARLACYDSLAAGTAADAENSASASAPQPPALETAATEGPAPITDDVGLVPEEDDLPQYAVRVTGCRETARGQQLFFFLENGQVWKQSDYRRLRLKDCVLDGVIVKGGFGYRLELPALDRSVRVARVR